MTEIDLLARVKERSLAEVHPIDRATGLMQGEVLYMGEPTEIISARR